MPNERLLQEAKGRAAVNLCRDCLRVLHSVSAAGAVAVSRRREDDVGDQTRGKAGDSVIGVQDRESTIVGRLFAGGRDVVYSASKVGVVVRILDFELMRRGDDNVGDVVNMDSTRRG